ncbi:MAG: hypothetical protein JKY53_11285 [Flavobacteriales bacterium]|nr:hypothetical protein [Flavobacteriales bacterium]
MKNLIYLLLLLPSFFQKEVPAIQTKAFEINPSPFIIDIRNHYLKHEVTDQDSKKGRELLIQMQNASGGKENWQAHKRGTFIQKADWYGKLKMSHWDTLPQLYQLSCELGKNEGDLTYLNGPNSGTVWRVDNGSCYSMPENGEPQLKENKIAQHKIEFKSYWFQFPFRISEAEFVSYAGETTIDGVDYELVYATWGSEKANKQYDQFILYLNKKTHFTEQLHFTVREVSNAISFTARFDGFNTFDGITLPTSQYITKGRPEGKGRIKFHENHYTSITFGN